MRPGIDRIRGIAVPGKQTFAVLAKEKEAQRCRSGRLLSALCKVDRTHLRRANQCGFDRIKADQFHEITVERGHLLPKTLGHFCECESHSEHRAFAVDVMRLKSILVERRSQH